MRLCVDLCCGLGGFSAAFMDDPNWEVLRIDISSRSSANIIADVRSLPLKDGLHPDVLFMSPPCERFSIAQSTWPRKGIRNALDIVGACLEAVVTLGPQYWMLENPKGRLRWFTKSKPVATVNLGDYGYRTIKPTDFWGNIPLGIVSSHRNDNDGLKFREGIRSPAKRAVLPYKFSYEVKMGVENELEKKRK